MATLREPPARTFWANQESGVLSIQRGGPVMRLRIPFVPFAVRFERRPLEPISPRLTVRTSMLIIGLLAVAVWWYVSHIALPAARQRLQRADGLFRLHLAVIDGAYQEEVKQEQDARAAARRCLEFSERERREAERWPEGTEERTTHRDFAALWDKSESDHSRTAEFAARRARRLKQRMEELLERRRQAEGDISKIEDVAEEAGKWPETPGRDSLHLGKELAFRLQRMLAQGGMTSLQVGNKPIQKPATPGP
jgi:hypothetical protein